MGDGNQWWCRDTVAVVTGGNKGLGYGIVKGLASQGVTTILTARDESRGLEALNFLKEEHYGNLIHFHKLDVATPASVDEFADWLVSSFGGLNILINNAGTAGLPGLSKLENSRAVLETNFYGVQRVTQKLLPLFKDCPAGGRIVNVSSGTSRLDNLKNESLREELSDIEKLTHQQLEEIVQRYLHDVENDVVSEQKWSGFFGNYDYSTSKMFLNAYSRLLARELEADPSKKNKVFVNCMCPGLTNTGMTNAGHSPEVGADTAVWLALLPPDEASSGNFFIRRSEVGFMQIPYYYNDKFGFALEEYEPTLLRELLEAGLQK